MPIEITSFLMLEDKKYNGWAGGRNITHIISLDEGHDRAYWQWVKHPKLAKFKPSSVWIPEAPETALRDGLLMLIADGLEDVSLQALIPYENGSFGRVDLDRQPTISLPGVAISAALSDYIVHVISFPDASLRNQLVEGVVLNRGAIPDARRL
jgi:hypothetical protein